MHSNVTSKVGLTLTEPCTLYDNAQISLFHGLTSRLLAVMNRWWWWWWWWWWSDFTFWL